MRRLAQALLFLILTAGAANAQNTSPTGPPYNFTCNQWYQASWSATVTNSLAIPGIVGKGIYICGWHVTTNLLVSQSTFQIVEANATTDPASRFITPTFGVTSAAPSADHTDLAGLSTSLFTAPTSPENVYVNIGGTGNIQMILYYGQY